MSIDNLKIEMNNATPDYTNIIVKAEREIAYSSPDHLHPWGTRRDNSHNRTFNQKLYRLFAEHKHQLRVLDIGCAGGGFVKDCLDDGCLAIGLEGSDFSKRHKRAEWAIIPDFLFTCDVTGYFEILFNTEQNEPHQLVFDVVTSWELLEHIAESDLAMLIQNVKRHLAKDGLWISSVSPKEDIVDGARLHQTVKPKSWWIEMFATFGLHHIEPYNSYFNSQYIRGPKYEAPDSFHLILSRDPSNAPKIPNQKIPSRIYDIWLGSRPQRLLRRLVIGN